MEFHIVGRARSPHQPFAKEAVAARFWKWTRDSFQDQTLAFVMMPEHFHWAGTLDEPGARKTRFTPETAVARFDRILRRLSQEFRLAPATWESMAGAEPIVDRQKLRRSIRYIFLNPCRRGLVKDPLAWRWSTYRDWVGAGGAESWSSSDILFRRLAWRSTGESFHRYVSSDPSVCISGTPWPVAASVTHWDPARGLDEIARAAAAAFRVEPADLAQRRSARDLFIHLARSQGWRDSGVLARRMGVHPQTVRRVWKSTIAPPTLRAGLLCLGDSRFR